MPKILQSAGDRGCPRTAGQGNFRGGRFLYAAVRLFRGAFLKGNALIGVSLIHRCVNLEVNQCLMFALTQDGGRETGTKHC